MPCALYRTWVMRKVEDADEVCFLSSFCCVVTVTAWYLGGYAILNAYLPMRISSPCSSTPHTLLGMRWLSGILVFFVLAKVYAWDPTPCLWRYWKRAGRLFRSVKMLI